MAITKTLGGDRLGSGKKQQVHMHGYERSNHDLGYIWRSSMSAGTLVPFMSKILLPGDTFDVHLNADIKTHPTIGPLFGSYKVQLDVFMAPIRLYNAFLHNNAINIGRKMSDIKLPHMAVEINVTATPEDITDLDNCQINSSCVLSYLGLRGFGLNSGGAEPVSRSFNIVNLLAYWEIVKQYYSNKQEEVGAVIHTPITAIVASPSVVEMGFTGFLTTIPLVPAAPVDKLMTAGMQIYLSYAPTAPLPSQLYVNTNQGVKNMNELALNGWEDHGTYLQASYNAPALGNLHIYSWRLRNNTDVITEQPRVTFFPLENIDKTRMNILKHDITRWFLSSDNSNLEPYKWLYTKPLGTYYNTIASQEGLALKTYQSDLLNNWISTEWIDGVDGITALTAIDTSSGEFTLDTLNINKKLYEMYNRIALSGGTYDDWLDVIYDHERYTRCESPMYLGGLIKELVFQEVVSNSMVEGADGTQPLGTLAGKGVMGQKHKGGHIIVKADEPAYLIGLISLTPRIDNSQGNSWDMQLDSVDSLHKPVLDQIGFQELITEQAAWWSTEWDGTKWVQKSAGKQPAWINYMTSINETRGNFAVSTNEMFMTLNRRYELDAATGDIKDMTTYIDPSKFNFIFAQTSLDSQNFWAQIGINIMARRKMSQKIIPNI